MNSMARLGAASALALAALPATAANILVNGSFEDVIGTVIFNGGSWTIQRNDLTGPPWPNGVWFTNLSGVGIGTLGIEVQTNATLATIDAQDGSHYLELDGDPSPGNSSIGQFFTTVIGTTYNFSFWYSPRTSDLGSMGVELAFGDPNNPITTGGFDGTGDVGTWYQVIGSFQATTTQSYFAFAPNADSDTLGALIDNVEITAAPVPVPAAVWLLGSAMLGLAGVSRRRRV